MLFGNLINKKYLGIIFYIIFLLLIIMGSIKIYDVIMKRKYIAAIKTNSKSIFHHPNVGCYDAALGWGLEPGAEDRAISSEFDVVYDINSLGCRDKEISLERKPEEFRVLALGESTVMGHGVSYGKRFTEVIEQTFNNVEVINSGVWGYGLDQSLIQFKRQGVKMKPNLVIIFVMEYYLERCKDFYRICEFKPRFVLRQNKKRLFLEDLDYVKQKYADAIDKITNLEDSEGATDEEYWQKVYERLDFNNKYREDYSLSEFKFLIYLLLKEYKSICLRKRLELMLVIMDDHSIGWLIDTCRQLNIDYLDLSGALKNASRYKRLRFNVDPHYNEFSHKVIGEYVSRHIYNKYNLPIKETYRYEYLDKF